MGSIAQRQSPRRRELRELERRSADCAAIGVIGVDVLLASRQNEYSGVVQPWRRGCPQSRGLLGTCWSPFAKARTSPFTAADSTRPIAGPTPQVPQSEESKRPLMLFFRF